jgi:hypothetical protein
LLIVIISVLLIIKKFKLKNATKYNIFSNWRIKSRSSIWKVNNLISNLNISQLSYYVLWKNPLD